MRASKKLLWILTLCAASVRGEVVDRVAVTTGQYVVTLSAIRRHLTLRAIVDNQPVADTTEERRKAADRLLDQMLIRREIELSRFTPPTMAEVEQLITQFVENRHQTMAQFGETLKKYGLSEDELRTEIQWRVNVMRFIDFRFAPGVQVSDDEVEKYYKEVFAPGLKQSNPEAAAVPLDEVRDRITRIVTVQKTNEAVDHWLAQMRETLRIRYFEAALQSPGGAKP